MQFRCVHSHQLPPFASVGIAVTHKANPASSRTGYNHRVHGVVEVCFNQCVGRGRLPAPSCGGQHAQPPLLSVRHFVLLLLVFCGLREGGLEGLSAAGVVFVNVWYDVGPSTPARPPTVRQSDCCGVLEWLKGCGVVSVQECRALGCLLCLFHVPNNVHHVWVLQEWLYCRPLVRQLGYKVRRYTACSVCNCACACLHT